jgi:hypothetical protein
VTSGAVSTEYEQAITLTALSRIFIFFLGSLLRFHTLVQDILLQTLCNSGLGFLALWMVRLFAIHPALAVAVGVALLLALYGLLRIFADKGKGGLTPDPIGGAVPLSVPPLAEQSSPVASGELNPVALSLTPTLALPPAPTPPPLTDVGSSSEGDTNQMNEQSMWSDEEEEEAFEMARYLESSSGSGSSSDDSHESDDSSDSWGDVQIICVTRTDSW